MKRSILKGKYAVVSLLITVSFYGLFLTIFILFVAKILGC